MFPKGESRGKHLVSEREIYSNISQKIMQQLFCHIGYITVFTNNIGYITVYTNYIGYITVFTNYIGYITVFTNYIG